VTRLVHVGLAPSLVLAPTRLPADRVTWSPGGMAYELGSPEGAGRHDAFRREYL